ncbi:hypothetical protein [Glaciimonas immobilis]|uniref:Uncharacterized protein n=1 Tax=Glaciimonas immobilis TaxID=728004 RepID=A0A840S069_9BURK|nr:hypothetical protein [Glaciimonas immobilis]KAF3997233.1 hypothetical protein HAV38_16410 [Glaciimonas immobilis]MBB5202284.1 hypothetical protein [Glaciimonas immobilis]
MTHNNLIKLSDTECNAVAGGSWRTVAISSTSNAADKAVSGVAQTVNTGSNTTTTAVGSAGHVATTATTDAATQTHF